MSKVKFKSFSTSKPKYFLSVKEENLNNFMALNHALRLIQAKESRIDVSLAFKNKGLVKLANRVSPVNFPAKSINDLGDNQVVYLNIDKGLKAVWENKDRADEFEYRTKKYPGISPDKLQVPNFEYNEYIAIMRDAVYLFELPLDHPMHIVLESRCIQSLPTLAEGTARLKKEGILSGPFSLVERGFAHWNSPEAPKDWGRVVWLPSPEDLLKSEDTLFEYIGLINHPDCVAIGVHSTDYVAPTVGAFKSNTSVIWDLRPSFAKEGEDLKERLLTSFLLPDSKNIFAPTNDPQDVEPKSISRELAYALSVYYAESKVSFSKGRGKSRVDRPLTPQTFEWNPI